MLFRTEKFSFKAGIFSAEVSDLGSDFERVGDGLRILNPKTNRIVRFELTDVKRDAEGDVLFWTLSAVHEDWMTPEMDALKVVLFND